MRPKSITTSRTVLRKLKLGGSLEVHPWGGGYHLWDENGGRYSIPVVPAAAEDAIRSGKLTRTDGRFSVFSYTYAKEQADES